MTKKNITLASILLLILTIIIGIIFSSAKPRALGLGGLGLSLLERQTLTVDSQGVNALEVGTLNVGAAQLSGASPRLLNV